MKLLFISTLAIWLAGPTYAITAEQMRIFCEPVLASEKTYDGAHIAVPQTFEAGVCWGASDALIGFLDAQLGGSGKPALNVCLPTGASQTQVIRVFVKYVDDHPEQIHENWAYIAWRAMIGAFPC